MGPRTRRVLGAAAASFALSLAGCGADPYPDDEPGTLHTFLINEMKGFDPVEASEEIGSTLVQNVYDGLYEYHYLKRPFELVPSLAAGMPTSSEDGLTVTIPLRKGVHFADDPCFPGGKGREFVADDVIFCFERFMDQHVSVKGTWVFEGFIEGLDDFRKASAKAPENWNRAAYTADEGYPPVSGLSSPDPHTLVIRLTGRYPQLPWVLAMGYTSIYPREAIAYYGREFMNHPVSTGPYLVDQYVPGQKLVLVRNPTYRTDDLYPSDGEPDDRAKNRLGDAGKPLPLNSRVVATVFKETQPMWLYFLSGYLDRTGIPKDNFDGAVDPATTELRPELSDRGVTLDKDPRVEVIYDAFNQRDAVVGAPNGAKGLAIRRAMSLAFDEDWANVNLYNNRVTPVAGPIVEEFPEFDPNFVNPWKRAKGETREHALDRARALLAEAGLAGGRGIPPITYEVQPTATDEQFFLAAQRDFKQVGIELRANRVTWQEMMQRVDKAQAQMWGVSWGADYPEAQNFLQLFYGPNAAPGPNGANFSDAEFDALYDRAQRLGPTEERKDLYRRMQRIVVDRCVWIFKYRRLNFNLNQPWLANFRYNDISPRYFKYCRVDDARRAGEAATLNRKNPWWVVGALAAFAVLGVATVAWSGRVHRGW